jgi:tetracycline repressor-like protein
VQRTLADPRQGALFKAVIAAAACEAKTAEALHHFYDIRVKEWAPCVQQAVDRGEVPEGTDTHEVIRAVSAPLYYRLLTTGDHLDEAAADRAAEAAAAAARAGAYLRSNGLG